MEWSKVHHVQAALHEPSPFRKPQESVSNNALADGAVAFDLDIQHPGPVIKTGFPRASGAHVVTLLGITALDLHVSAD